MAVAKGTLTEGSYAHQCLTLLLEHGPMTARDLAHEIGTDVSNIRARLAAHPELWHVSGYQREQVDGRLYPRAMYRAGPGRDAAKPPPLSGTTYSRRYRARKRSTVNSVFALGTPVNDMRIGAARMTK